MSGVGTRRQLSRLFLPLSSSAALHVRLLLVLLLGQLVCEGHARAETSDLIRRLVDQPERRYPRGELDIKGQSTEWTFRKSETSTRSSEHLYYLFADSPEDPNDRPNWLRFIPYRRDHRNRSTIETPLDRDYWADGAESQPVNDQSLTISETDEEVLKSTSYESKIQTFSNTSSGPYFVNRERKRSATDFSKRSRNSLKDSRGGAESMNHGTDISGSADRGINEKTTRRNRINRSKLSVNKEEHEETEVKDSQKIIPSVLPSNDSEEIVDPPFTGFEGSQKFPMKVTYKPPVVQQVEKFDRRHFKPPKVEITEETWYFTTPALDLPKSPSRDRRLKMDKSAEENGRIGTTPEGSERGNETSDDSLLAESTTPEFPFSETSEKSFPQGQSTSTAIAAASSTGAEASESNVDGEAREASAVSPPPVKTIEKINVTILGLFEMTQGMKPRPEGPSELQAARLAVKRVNEMNILPKFRLRLIHNDTKCDAGVGVDRFFHALYSSSKDELMPLLLGTACSEVSETLAKIVPYWNIVQVSFGSTAPALSDTTEFPLFIRTVAPDSSHNPARIALVKHFGWDTVTALSQTGDMYSLAVNDLVTELEQANITCTATITFAENDYKEQLRTLKELDTRIIIGSFSPRLAPRVFCEAWKLGMHGGDYAWILPDDTINLSGMTGDWWHPGPEECSPSQLTQTLDGLIIVKSHATVFGNEISSSGLTSAEFTSELAKLGVTHSRFAGQTYDAVWAMGLALASTELHLNLKNSSMTEYSHNRKDLAQQLLEQLKLLQFIGVSGPVSFDGADRVGITAFYQMQGHAIRRIAIFTPKDGELIMNCPGCVATRWPGGHPPAARRVFRLRLVTVAPAAFLAVTCLASVGVTLALAFLAFNLHFRKHKSIKLSSPRLNNMAAVGCGLVYGAVILLGLDHATLPDSDGYFPAVCTARVYLLSAGFSLAFGSMFTKTYRVHKIFTRSRSGVVKNKLLQDTQLISLICVLLLIDGLVVTLWVTLDPMQRHLRNLTLEINPQDRGVVYQPQVEVCRSQHTNGWLGALYAYKGLLLVVGVYMAWETRHVKIPALNDSQYIGMSVYSVVITSGIVVVLANLMSDRATLAFVTITALILASTTSTLALLFLPQLANILAGERADPVIQSLGLKIECNTRRFVTDDRSELQYRVEVQNRVYRREMAQLELELARLEKQLGQEPPVEPSHASSNTSLPQRNPSIGGGLPLLLLSVLPPVIPRASWPSADPAGMRRGTVAFSSQPDLEPDGPRRSLADIYKLHRRRETEGPNRLGVFQRLFSLFGSRPTSRKTSTASFSGVASALRVHMGYIAGLVPGAKAASTCQVDTQGTRSPQPRCGSGPIISITSEEDRRLSLGLRRKESSEPRVNFSLPPQTSASQTSSREKIKGSPRFPHRIVPANSLGTIPPGSFATKPQRWHSMEDARKSKTVATPRGSSCSPNNDVWATREVGIPLSEFLRTNRAAKPPETLPLTITADSDVSPDDGRLGNDLRKLFRENDMHSALASPLESERDYLEPTLSPSPSQITLKVSTVESNNSGCSNESHCDSREAAGQNSGIKFLQDGERLRLDASGQKTSTVNPTEMKSMATLPTNFRTGIPNDETVNRNGKVQTIEQEYPRLSGPKVIVTHSGSEVKLSSLLPLNRDAANNKNGTSPSAAPQAGPAMLFREPVLSHPSSPKKVTSRHSKLRSSSSSPTALRMLQTSSDVSLYSKEFRSDSFLGITAQKVEAALHQEPQFSRPSSPKMIVTNSPIDESVEHEDRTASQSDSGEPTVV